MGKPVALAASVRGWLLVCLALSWALSCARTPPPPTDLELVTRFWSPQEAIARRAGTELRKRWSSKDGAALIECLYFTKDPKIRERLVAALEELSQEPGGEDLDRWWRWAWNQPAPPAYYSDLKAILYGRIDPRFRNYFQGQPRAEIRLDEVAWGGVVQDGIPPLDHPTRTGVSEAGYLNDRDVVFGFVHRGQALAYPKRILAWHELARDRINGEELTLVYCTLCGSCILYRSGSHVLGTSGFLYRSNKLMYDRQTQSLWSTLEGRPVVGALVGRETPMEMLPVATTTWGEWRKLHPKTQVLSEQTGHRRDYGEGVAYREYFSHDRTMFPVSVQDKRLANKAEVLTLRLGGEALAVATADLPPGEILPLKLADRSLLAIHRGGRRVYDVGGHQFTQLTAAGLREVTGALWEIREDALVGPRGTRLPRFPSHEAFWFGWVAAYPHTRLWTRPAEPQAPG